MLGAEEMLMNTSPIMDTYMAHSSLASLTDPDYVEQAESTNEDFCLLDVNRLGGSLSVGCQLDLV